MARSAVAGCAFACRSTHCQVPMIGNRPPAARGEVAVLGEPRGRMPWADVARARDGAGPWGAYLGKFFAPAVTWQLARSRTQGRRI